MGMIPQAVSADKGGGSLYASLPDGVDLLAGQSTKADPPPDGVGGLPKDRLTTVLAGSAPDTPSNHGPEDWGWRRLSEFTEFPKPTPVVNGLLVEGGLSLLYAPSKTGKSRFIMALLAALSPYGPTFCGMRLVPTPTLLFTEEPPHVLGERVATYNVGGDHYSHEASAIAMPASAFAEQVYLAHHQLGGEFGLVIVDTLGAFVNVQDLNDYSQTGQAFGPLRQLARAMSRVAFLYLHHQRKAGGDGWDGALGSAALTGSVDQLIKMERKDGQHRLTVGGRFDATPFPFDEPVAISIQPDGVEVLGTATDMLADAILAAMYDCEPLKIDAIVTRMGNDAPGRDTVSAAVKKMVTSGDVVQTEPARGNKPALYQLPEN